MTDRVTRYGLQIATELFKFTETKALPGTGVDAETFWSGFAKLVEDLTPTNRALLAKRDEIQKQIDSWHIAHKGQEQDMEAYKAFLSEIGYLVPEGEDFQIETANVDPEIATIPGPQLVVPIMNARYALNAANARWAACMMPFTEPMHLVICLRKAHSIRHAARGLLHGLKNSLTTRRHLQVAPTKMPPDIQLKTAC